MVGINIQSVSTYSQTRFRIVHLTKKKRDQNLNRKVIFILIFRQNNNRFHRRAEHDPGIFVFVGIFRRVRVEGEERRSCSAAEDRRIVPLHILDFRFRFRLSQLFYSVRHHHC